MRQIKRIVLTGPQGSAVLSHQKKKYLEWGRGSGKSFILAFFMLQFVKQMPGATFFIVGATYSQILSTTLPSTKQGLEMLNILEDVDYVIGRSGKSKGYAMPLQAPNQWTNVIHFSNGTIFVLISQDNPNSGRGFNTYGGIGDEAALLDPVKLFNQAQATNRATGKGTAKYEIYQKAEMLGAQVYASSTPITKKGKWFTEMEAQALLPENYNKIFFSKASSLTNPNNNPDWYRDMKENIASELMYNAEILNIRPAEITDGFYANLVEKKHYYTDYDTVYLEGQIWLPKPLAEKGGINLDCKQDNDLRRNQPLILSFDFGVFNSLTVNQYHKDINEYRTLKSMWAKSPKLLDDLLIEQFIPYYSSHQEKIAYVYGGHDGHLHTPNSSRTLYQQIQDLLRAHGWTVYIMAKTHMGSQARRYLLINTMLKEVNPKLPKIRINEPNNPDLIVSLERAEAEEGTKGIEKNKRPEKNKSLKQQHTTHLSDAWDAPLYDMFWDIYDAGNSSTAGEAGILLLS